MTSPVGLIIGGGSSKQQWKVGKQIGSGACASVHLLKAPDGKESGFVVKVASLPTKITKKKTTIPERNARLLYKEAQIYQNMFSNYRGSILPKAPSYVGPPQTGDVDGKPGFRFLVLEKMKAPLWDVIPDLLKTGSSVIDVGPIALQLLECVCAFHEERHLLVDIKPENFMLAYSSCDRKKFKGKWRGPTKRNAAADELADKVRVLDLGLATRWNSADGHRPNEGINELIGTPLYSSLHMHKMNTPSRRDDMEALGFVVSELIIRLVAAAKGESDKFESANEDDVPTFLPWSHGASDEAIGKLKANEVKSIKSKFYQRMGDKKTAETFYEYFKETRAMEYTQSPDFEKFAKLLGSLSVTLDPPKNKAATKSPKRPIQSSRTTRSKRVASRIESEDIEEEGASPKKQQKQGDEEEFYDADMDIDSEDGKGEVFEEAMDWEPVKENQSKSGPSLGVKIIILEGPHKGQHFDLNPGTSDTVVIGKNPEGKKRSAAVAELLWPIPSDPDADDVHARLELRTRKQVYSVKLTDMKSSDGVLVGSKRVTRGKNVQLFVNDKFQVGQSVFKVTSKSQVEGASKKPAATTPKASAAGRKKPLAQKAVNTKADVILKVVQGPHLGESFPLIHNDAEVINLGSTESSAKKGDPVILSSDAAIEKTHARIQLRAGKKMLSVAVTDLSESGTFVNGKQTKKQKEHVAFLNDKIQVGDTVLEVLRG